MKHKFKFYKQVKTLWYDRWSRTLSYENSDLYGQIFYSRVNTTWFAYQISVYDRPEYIVIRLSDGKWFSHCDVYETFVKEAFQEIEPSEKQYKKAEKKLPKIIASFKKYFGIEENSL